MLLAMSNSSGPAAAAALDAYRYYGFSVLGSGLWFKLESLSVCPVFGLTGKTHEAENRANGKGLKFKP